MRFSVITLFPEMFTSPLGESILKKAISDGKIIIDFYNPRDYTLDKHKKVDDIPYGGGGGMLMTCQPLFDCLEAVKKTNKGPVIFLTPDGKRFSQSIAERLSKKGDLILLCGRYEGIDQRVRDRLVDMELSIGDYVLTGGEIPAMAIIDAVSRLVPDVITDTSSHHDSFSKSFDRKKEYPHYTRPEEFRGMKVPDVLISGNHKEIEKWRKGKLR